MVPGFLQSVAEWWVLECIIFAASALRGSQERGIIAATAVVGNLQAVFIMAWSVSVASLSPVGRSVSRSVGHYVRVLCFASDS